MLLLLAFLGHAADPSVTTARVVPGRERSVTLDLWRAAPGADKVYVKADLPDGSPALFMLDTGAGTSVIHRELAERLGLDVKVVESGRIEGISGSVEWRRATLPFLKLGAFQVNGVEVAVDVPGVPEEAGPLPIAGILGNNVWVNFGIEVDYPADTLVLHAPGTWKLPKRAAPLRLDALHAATDVEILAADGTRATVSLEVDTGATGLLFQGATGEPFRGGSTEGIEPVFGIGASLDDLPLASFLQVTRRVAVERVWIGGREVAFPARARWYGADAAGRGRVRMPGLVGYGPISNHVAAFDFANGRFALQPSRRPARSFDAWSAWLAIEREQHGEAPERAATRARLEYVKGDRDAALRTIQAGLTALPKDAALSSLLSWLHRNALEWDLSLAALADVPPAALAEEGEWVAYVNSLVLAGQVERAVAEATAAVEAVAADQDGRDDVLVALSDALVAAGRLGPAGGAIVDASDVTPGGSAHLLRKARISALEKDTYGALATLRELWTLLPLNGTPMWMYAQLTDPAQGTSFVADIDNTLARLHPGDEPWDFVGAAFLALGQEARGREALAKGHARDCAPLPPSADRRNCDAWYWALGNERLDEAKASIDAAIAEVPWASAYRDTAATVAMARGDAAEARTQALIAARLSPGDPYLLWQLDRVDAKFPR
jgi:hypothetical protein